MGKIAETPLMKQYLEMKRKHPDAILLFRVGDFYETFSDDAVAASEILGITLTRRGNGSASYVELAGFPHHALDSYLPKLVRAGRRVAICEQLEDPKLAKKLVKRGITELVTPGLNMVEGSLAPKENNFLAAVSFSKPKRGGSPEIGVAFLDLTTGEFLCGQGEPAFADKLLSTIRPKEIVRLRGSRQVFEQYLHHKTICSELDDWVFTSQSARERLLKQFSVDSLKGFGIDNMEQGIISAGAILHYLDYTSHTHTAHITSISRIDSGQYLYLDRFTMRNLEILAPANAPEGEGPLSLSDVLDHTSTPMGSRMLKHWLSMPLLDLKKISERHDCIDALFRDPDMRGRAAATMREVGDLSRLASKVASRRANPRELLTLMNSLLATSRLQKIISQSDCEPLNSLALRLHSLSSATSLIRKTISADAPNSLGKGNVIAPGVDAELDRLRFTATHGREAIEKICSREIERTGITSLKIGYNNVFGYYIEVRNTHKEKVPADWIRKQTLVNAERYITPELKEYEQTVAGAQEKIELLEHTIYDRLLDSLTSLIGPILDRADAASRIDCLLSLATAAEAYGYIRPEVNDSTILDIKSGRHPVIERRLPPGETYVANDINLDSDNTQVMMITGPNMSGKSALLRQTALIVLMAQAGSFVPAQAATIGLTDKIMTRVGASDNLAAGESTFMVEMNEAAAILNNMTSRSLILFDELGRGTSTYDGISIARAIVEHIHENGRCRPKTLFATHYHELNEMEKTFRRIVNFNVSVSEIDGKVVFLRKLMRGGSEHSFGIHVARLAGMPPSIVKRADQILKILERGSAAGKDSGSLDIAKAGEKEISSSRQGVQLSIFQLDDPLLSQIRDALLDIDVNRLTPLEALTKLNELQGLLKGH